MTHTEKIIFGILVAALVLLIFMMIRSFKNKREEHIYERFAQTSVTYPASVTSASSASSTPHTARTAYTMHAAHAAHAAPATPAVPVSTTMTPTVHANIKQTPILPIWSSQSAQSARNAVQDRLQQVLENMQRQIHENRINGLDNDIDSDLDSESESDIDTDSGLDADVTDTTDTTPTTRAGAHGNAHNRNPEEFFDDIQRNNHNNDSQNVHNTQINVSLARKYDRLYELHMQHNKDLYDALPGLELNFDDVQEMKITSSIRDIGKFADAHIRSKYTNPNDPEQIKHANTEREKITCVLTEIRKGNTITSISNAVDENGSRIPISEDWILTLVWERIQSHDDASVRKNLQEALYDQLIDATYSFNSGGVAGDILRLFFGNNFINDVNTTRVVIRPVCINGRVARMISSFTMIDTDPILAAPEKDDKEIANEAYTKASRILEDELNKFTIDIPESQETSIRELYSKDDSELNDSERTAVRDFSNHVKKVMADTLRREYEQLIDEKLLLNIINNSISVL